MKSLKKVIPFISALSIVGVVTPTIASCSKSVSFEITTPAGRPYQYSSTPIEWTEPAITPAIATRNYFDAVKNNWKILLDDFFSVIVSDPVRYKDINYLKMTVNNVSDSGLELRMSIDWIVNYNLTPICTYVTKVRITNFPFVASAISEDPQEPGVVIRPSSSELDVLKTIEGWQVEYYYEESSPVGLVNRTYIYNPVNITSPVKYPTEAFTTYILEMLTYESRYFQNVLVTQ